VSIEVQVDGLRDLQFDLGKIPKEFEARAKRIVGQGCNNIKKDWRARWIGHRHIPHLPFTITYDVTMVGDTIVGEVGPDKGKNQGPLGNIIEFGTINNAPIPGGQPALDAEEPRFARYVEELGVDMLEGR
jgi:hypothetical protein